MNLMELSTIAAAGFLSALIKNGVGVGSGIFLLPVLTLVFPAKTALGIGAPIMLGSDIIGLRNYWREWASTRELLWLLVPAVPGLLLGTWLIPVIPGHVFRMGVGVFGMAYALGMLFPRSRIVTACTRLLPRPRPGARRCSAVFYGMLGGIATVMCHAGGLVWSLYLLSTQKDRRVFVGTIVLSFAITNLYKTFAYLHIGILDTQTLLIIALSLPAIYLGSFFGNILNKRSHHRMFRIAVLVVIFIVSLLLMK